METQTLDIYSRITNQIIEAIDDGVGKEKCSLPWYPIDNQNPMPRNGVHNLSTTLFIFSFN